MKSCTVVAIAVLMTAPQVAHAQHVEPPNVPSNIEVPVGNRPFLKGHAVGTQNYICLPSANGFAWTLFGPQATLFDVDSEQITTHFLSANPSEAGLPRATWQDSRDTSSVWAGAIAASTDPAFVAPGAIPWLLLQVFGAQDGPVGGNRLTPTTFIHRVNTRAGAIPAKGCGGSKDVGKKALVPYEADYVFYRDSNGE